MLRFARLFKNGRRNQNNGYSEKWKQKWCRRPRLIDFDHNIEINLAKEIFWIYCVSEKSDSEYIIIDDIEEQI